MGIIFIIIVSTAGTDTTPLSWSFQNFFFSYIGASVTLAAFCLSSISVFIETFEVVGLWCSLRTALLHNQECLCPQSLKESKGSWADEARCLSQLGTACLICVCVKRDPYLMWPAEDIMWDETLDLCWLNDNESLQKINSIFGGWDKISLSMTGNRFKQTAYPGGFFPTLLSTDWSQHWLFLLKGWGTWRAKG